MLGTAIIAWSAAEAARGGTKTESLEEAQRLPANNNYITQHTSPRRAVRYAVSSRSFLAGPLHANSVHPLTRWRQMRRHFGNGHGQSGQCSENQQGNHQSSSSMSLAKMM